MSETPCFSYILQRSVAPSGTIGSLVLNGNWYRKLLLEQARVGIVTVSRGTQPFKITEIVRVGNRVADGASVAVRMGNGVTGTVALVS